MTKLLIAIDRRTRYLERALPPATRKPGEFISVALPAESWASPYQGMSIPVSVLPNLEKIYGAEAARLNESPVVTMIRYAATAGERK